MGGAVWFRTEELNLWHSNTCRTYPFVNIGEIILG